MFLARPAVFALVTFSLLACSGNDLTTPADIDPLFAKPVKIQEPVIQEFWVVPGATETARDIIHLVVSDNVHSVDPWLIYDYFHNGIVDDNPPEDQHFELGFQGPPRWVVEDWGDGWVHVGIPWDGSLWESEPNLHWPDHLSIEIPDEGDPFVFLLVLQDVRGKSLGWAIPRGIVIGGEEIGEVEVNLSDYKSKLMPGSEDQSGNVRSFATFKGLDASGVVSLSSLDVTELVCEKESVTTGRGKNREVEDQYRISAQISVGIAGAGSNYWWEGHFLTETGVLSPRITQGNTVSVVMPSDWDGQGKVEFVVDFLFSQDPLDLVYDPWMNVVTTTAGFDGPVFTRGPNSPNPRSGIEDGMAFPVAHSETFVTCSGG